VYVKEGSPDSARRAVLHLNNAGYLFGLFGGVEDRCDIVLRNASELRVRNQPEKVNGVAVTVQLPLAMTASDDPSHFTGPSKSTVNSWSSRSY